MQVKDVMTANVKYIAPTTNLETAAREMRELDCGFLAVSDPNGEKLSGVVTDRDIAIRAVADGLSAHETMVEEIMSPGVLYCCADDDIGTAADSMRNQCVYRLIVLNNREDKQLCGVVSLGDLTRHDQETLAGEVAKGITETAA